MVVQCTEFKKIGNEMCYPSRGDWDFQSNLCQACPVRVLTEVSVSCLAVLPGARKNPKYNLWRKKNPNPRIYVYTHREENTYFCWKLVPASKFDICHDLSVSCSDIEPS